MIITETIKKSALKTAIASSAAKGLKLMGASAAVTLGVIGGIAVAGVVIEQSGKFMNRRKAKAEGKSTAQADKEYEAAAKAAAADAPATNTFKNAVKRASDVVKESEKVVAKSAAAADKALDKTRDIIKDMTGSGTSTPTEADLKAIQEAADKAARDLAEFADKPLGEVAAPAAPNSEVFDANAQGSIIEDVLNKSMEADKAAKAAKDAKDAPAEVTEHAPVTEVPKPAADVSAPSAIADAVKEIGKDDAK